MGNASIPSTDMIAGFIDDCDERSRCWQYDWFNKYEAAVQIELIFEASFRSGQCRNDTGNLK